jgi:hypothetical protein
MLSALALVTLFGWMTLAVAAMVWLVDGLERRRFGRVLAEVQVTEAVHGELGPIVAPTVALPRARPWTVTMDLGPGEIRLAGRLTEIARRTLGDGGTPVRMVFVSRTGY